MFDWILNGARLSDAEGARGIGLVGRQVGVMASRLKGVAQSTLELDGRLVLPGFLNAYARVGDAPDLEVRVRALLETAIRHGTTTLHLSVPADRHDPEALLQRMAEIRADVADRISLVLALRWGAEWRLYARTDACERARQAGAHAIEIDVAPCNEFEDAFTALARSAATCGLALDLDMDAALPAGEVDLDTLMLPRVLDRLEALADRPAVRLLHATALAAVHRDALQMTLVRLGRLGIPLVLCPFETLRTAARADVTAARRGVPRLREFMAADVSVHLGSGAATDASALDPLAMVWLAAYATHLGTPAALELSRALIAPGSVLPGVPADLVVLEAATFAQAVVDHAEKAFVFKAGRLVHRAARVATQVETMRRARRLVVRQARLLRREGCFDVAIEDDVIRTIAPRIDTFADEELMAEGRLLIPAFVDAHLHLDKTFVMEGLALGPTTLTVAEAIAVMHRAKVSYSPDDLLARGRQTLRRALRHGITAIRAQCDVDPMIGLMALEALVALRREFADRLDLQIVAFPQEGLVGNPKAVDLMRQALRSGADAVGGGPLDADYRQHIAQVFALAREFDAPVDIHADLAIDRVRPLADWEAPLIATHARASGLAGRIAIGHFAASSTLAAHELRLIADQLRDAGVSVAALPASEMYRQGMSDPVNSRRGVPRVRELLDAGVNVVFASNNLRDAFVTFGNADMVEQALLCSVATQLDDMETALEMVTTRAARMIGLGARDGVAKGRQADLVLLDACTAAEAIGHQAEKLVVIRRGRIVARHRVELDGRPQRSPTPVHRLSASSTI